MTGRRRAKLVRTAGIGIFLAAAGAAGRAGAVEPLSFEEAVRTARARNPAVLGAQAGREAAREGHREARTSWLPTVTFREVAVRTDSPADVFGLQLMQERFSFPAFTARDPNDPDDLENYTTEIEARMPVFAGGRVWLGIAEAGSAADAAEALADHTRSAVELAAAAAYMDALLARQAVDLAERARETTARHVDQAQAWFDAGMMVESDLLLARVQLARMEEEVIRARNGARLALAGLNRAMGVDQSREHELTTALPAADPPPGDLETASALARAGRRDLRAAESRVRAGELGVTQAWGRYLPEIGLAAKLAWNDDTPFGAAGNSYTVAASLSWEVWNWGRTRHGVRRTRWERESAVQSRRALEQQVEFEVRRALQEVEEARARHEVASRAVAQAERALEILDQRFREEVARMTELLDAETTVHESRLRELTARFDLQKAIRNLYFATGASPVPEVSS